MAQTNQVNVVIPSFGRAHRLLGKNYFKTARYVVPQSQAADYVKVVGEKRVIGIPDKIDGNVARKRNWILDNIERPLLMINDDVRAITHTESMEGREQPKQMIELTPDQAMGVIVQGFSLAYEWGIVLWGINQNTDGRNYKQYCPFHLARVILGPFQGHLDHDLHYDERLDSKDDYDFSLQVLRKHKKILRFDKYAYDCDHGNNEGGIVLRRTMEYEMEMNERIMKKWGKGVIWYSEKPKNMADVLNARVNVPIKGV